MTTRYQALRRAVAGTVVEPGDAAWDGARRAWNLAVDQHPAVVVEAAGPDDVRAVVDFARANGIRVAPQATGHGAGRLGPLEDCVLLKTMALRDVSVDDSAARAG